MRNILLFIFCLVGFITLGTMYAFSNLTLTESVASSLNTVWFWIKWVFNAAAVYIFLYMIVFSGFSLGGKVKKFTVKD